MKHETITFTAKAPVATPVVDQRQPAARDRQVFINIDHNPAKNSLDRRQRS